MSLFRRTLKDGQVGGPAAETGPCSMKVPTSVWVADPDAVLISKACKAPEKNIGLITEYLAKGASERFFELAQKYALDLEQFV